MYYSNNQINNPYMRPSYQAPQPIQKNEFAWVQGEAGAKGFMVPPGMTMWLMDSENPVFYLKSTDMNGFPQPLRIFDFKERVSEKPVSQNSPETAYVTRDEMKAYIEEILKHESIVQSNESSSAKSNAEHGENVATVHELPKQL